MSPRSIQEVPLPAPAVIDAVRQSCSALPPGSTHLADRFYQNLFAMAPSIRDMFPANMRTQKERMAFALLEVVRYLDEPEEVAGYLRQLGAQHKRSLGVRPEHYPYVGRALVRAVSEVSPTWSSSMSSAWIDVYEWITAHMLAGAEDPEAATPSRGSRHAAPARGSSGTAPAASGAAPASGAASDPDPEAAGRTGTTSAPTR